jgi:uncharacterized protein YjbI with pentapeptide repeats
MSRLIQIFRWDTDPTTNIVQMIFSGYFSTSAKCLEAGVHAGISFFRANLNGVRLIGGDFQGADLREAEINGANLSRSNLDRAKLSDVRARNAKFNEASLSGATLDGGIFNNADFSKANLYNASLYYCTFTGTKFDKDSLRDSFVYKSLFAHGADVQNNKIPN